MLGDEGETHPSSAAAPAEFCHRSTAERVKLKVDSDPFAKPSRHDRYLRQAALRGRPAEGIKSTQSGGCGNQFVNPGGRT